MRSEEKCIFLLHRRAAKLKRKRDNLALAGLGSLSVFLMAMLSSMAMTISRMPYISQSGQFTGASLLGESTGGYVLVGVISFSAAVVITVVCMRKRYRGNDLDNSSKSKESDREKPADK